MRKYTDRSRIIEFQRCGRRRFLGYHEAGMGLHSLKTPLPLAVGGAVHAGLEVLLKFCIGQPLDRIQSIPPAKWLELEDRAVAAALMDFSEHVSALELDANESATILPSDDSAAMIAQALGLAVDDPRVAELSQQRQGRATDFDLYLQAEQQALVEGMVRAYARRKLRSLWEQFEVLEVEREGEWQLSVMPDGNNHYATDGCPNGDHQRNYTEIVFMSRPDALLLERESGQLYILSYKTTAGWDSRKGKDAEHDMQGLSEGVEVEKRLGRWWEICNVYGATYKDIFESWLNAGGPGVEGPKEDCISAPMAKYLHGLSVPPRIHAIRYEYLLKGERRADKYLFARLGIEARSQSSHLVRGLYNHKTSQWNWAWKFKKDDGTNGSLSYVNWSGRPIWEVMSIKSWIDLLDSATPTMSAEDSTMGLELRLLGYACPAQSSGYTDDHPLDAAFLTPIVVYRNDDDLRDWLDQTEAQEVRIQEGLVQIEQATDSSERRHLLNVYFPMVRTSCEWPSTCPFVSVCYGGEDIRHDPLGSGKFRLREANHPQEQETQAGAS